MQKKVPRYKRRGTSRRNRDHAAAQVVLSRGLENLVPQDLGEWKLPSNEGRTVGDLVSR